MFRHTGYLRRALLGRYLIVTNTASACALDALADVTEQCGVECVRPHDWPRTLRMGATGLLLGPVDHFWYRLLDTRYPGCHAAAVAKKVSLDTLVYVPLAIILFYLLMCRLEGKTWRESVAETKQKFATTLELELLLWPVVQIINFRYVPIVLRVIFQNAVDFVWTMVMSYLKHHELPNTHIWTYWKDK